MLSPVHSCQASISVPKSATGILLLVFVKCRIVLIAIWRGKVWSIMDAIFSLTKYSIMLIYSYVICWFWAFSILKIIPRLRNIIILYLPFFAILILACSRTKTSRCRTNCLWLCCGNIFYRPTIIFCWSRYFVWITTLW